MSKKIFLEQINQSSASSGHLITWDGAKWAAASLDSTLLALAALNNTPGILEQTGADTFTKRSIGTANATDLLTRAGGDGRYSLAGHQHAISNVSGLQAALDAKESTFGAGTTSQYLRGDKTWQTLNKAAVGLSNVDNTADLAKPISTLTQTALNNKEDVFVLGTTAQYLRGDKTWQTLNKAAVGLSNVDNTSDANKPLSSLAISALAEKEPLFASGSTSQYLRGDKTWQALNKAAVGLSNVDNTSDANKPISIVMQAALDGKITRSLTGDVLADAAGVLTIQSLKITPSKLAVSSSNLVLDGLFEDITFWVGDFTVSDGADVVNSGPNWLGYSFAARSPEGNGSTSQIQAMADHAPRFSVEGGKKLRIAANFLVKAGYTGRGGIQANFYDKFGTRFTTSAIFGTEDYRTVAAVTDVTNGVDEQFFVPLGAYKASVRLIGDWSTTLVNDGCFYVADVRAQMVVDASEHVHDFADISGLAEALATKEAIIPSGTSLQYIRGDKTLATLNKAAVALGNVDNTSDLNKPISIATQTALGGKANINHTHEITEINNLTAALSGKLSASAVSTFALTLLDDPSAVSARSTLGLGSAATQDITAFAPASHLHGIADVSGLQAALDTRQDKDATLSALADLNGSLGVIEQVGPDLFVKRAIGVAASSDLLTRAHADARFAALAHQHVIADVTGLSGALSSKEPAISASSHTNYWRGDKTWAVLDKVAIGLVNVDDTSDLNKPVSTATQTALNLKANLASPVFTGSVTLGADPTLNLHAATKQYVDNVAQGLDVKESVLCSTTANIALTGEQTLDGVLTSSSRVLVKNQANQAQNGIYVTASGAWSRAADMNVWARFPGAFVFIEQGTVWGDTGWVCTSNINGTLGSTAVTWSQFFGIGTHTGVSGISITGNVYSLSPMTPNSIKGNNTLSPAAPVDLTGSQVVAMLPAFGSATKGVVPASGGGIEKFLRADGTWATVISDSTSEWGNISGNLADQTDLVAALDSKIDDAQVTAFGLSLLDDEDAAAARTTLGIGSAATQPLAYFATASHTHNIAHVTGLQTALDGKINISQASAFGLSLLDDADDASARTTLGLGSAATQPSSAFAPSSHSHSISTIDGLQVALDLKANVDSPVFTGNVTFEDMAISDALSFGNSTRQMINLFGTSHGIGTQTNTVYLRTNTGFALYAAGSHVTTPGDPGTGGLALLYVRPDRFTYLSYDVFHSGNLVTATISDRGLMSAADKTKLDGIGEAATANSTDAQLRNRSTHTGTQAISTISGLQSALDGKMNASMVSPFIATLLDDNDAAAARTTLGIGSAALQASSAFAPASHTHAIGEVVGLQTALDGKISSSSALLSGITTIPYVFLNRTAGSERGIQWWSTTSNAWSQYMAQATQTSQGPRGNLTAPVGNYVTGMALRSFAENGSGMGWTWEAGTASSVTPSIIAELSSATGIFRTTGDHYVGTNKVYHEGAKPTKTDIGLGNADNTSDLNKPLSTAMTTALAGKAGSGSIGASGLTMATNTIAGRGAASTGSVEELLVGTGLIILNGALQTNLATVASTGSAGDLSSGTLLAARLPAFTGNVTSSAGSNVLSIASNAVSLGMLATVASGVILGRASASTGNVESLSGSEATSLLSTFTATSKGLVPAPTTVSGKYLRDDGTWGSSSGGSWGEISGTLSAQTDLQGALNAKENAIAAGSQTQYYRGDKTWATFNKAAVGLGNVDNTSDAAKPISTATQSALDAKASLTTSNEFVVRQRINLPLSGDGSASSGCGLELNAAYMVIGDSLSPQTYANGIGIKLQDSGVSSASIVWQSSILKFGASSNHTNLMPMDNDSRVMSFNTLTGVLQIGSNTVYHSGNLGNVDNTSDANKPISIATQTALDGKLGNSIATGRLLGRTTAGTGVVEQISIGTGLSLTGGVLSVPSTSFAPVSATGSGITGQVITLPVSGLAPEDVLVTINGVLEDPVEYSIAGDKLTLLTQVAQGLAILVRKPSGATGPQGGNAPVNITAATVNHVLVLTDRYVRANVASTNTVTIPNSSSVNFAVGTRIEVLQAGVGATTIAAGSGVTINTADTLALRKRYSACVLVKVGANEWDVFGDMA